MNDEPKRSRIILALDVESVPKAVALMDAVKGEVGMVKIGLELINAQIAGTVAQEAARRGIPIFWDGKIDDIPTTTGKAVWAAVRHGPRMINVHGSAGIASIRAAVENSGGAMVLVVTVLTSHDTESTKSCFGAPRDEKVLQFARLAKAAGAAGIICSPQELAFLDKYHDLDGLRRVVPGTRSAGVEHHDQKNVATPEAAILNGADWLVIGREITASENPAAAAQALNQRIAQTLAARAKFEPRKGAVAI